ncbi:hypothetical protein MBO12_01185 [Candidatus Saccharibacteria bacterium]|nr:hypothetical protein [Candidatus Saccharibacteria bacterium]
MLQDIWHTITENPLPFYGGYTALTALAITAYVIYLFFAIRSKVSKRYALDSYRNAFCVAIGGAVIWGFVTLLVTGGTNQAHPAIIFIIAILGTFVASSDELKRYDLKPRNVLIFLVPTAGITIATAAIIATTALGL